MGSNYVAKRAYKAPGSLTPEKQLLALQALETGISMAAAARAAGVSHETMYAKIRSDPDFAKRVEAAKDAGADRMEDALLSLGITDKQATPLIFLLKGRRPHIYRENVALTGGDGGPITFSRVVNTIVRPANRDR